MALDPRRAEWSADCARGPQTATLATIGIVQEVCSLTGAKVTGSLRVVFMCNAG